MLSITIEARTLKAMLEEKTIKLFSTVKLIKIKEFEMVHFSATGHRNLEIGVIVDL